jgi:hypothetical protein
MALLRFTFQLPSSETIPWAFDREPRLGEEITLGHHGVFRVMRRLSRNGHARYHGGFVVKLVRRATADDLKA